LRWFFIFGLNKLSEAMSWSGLCSSSRSRLVPS